MSGVEKLAKQVEETQVAIDNADELGLAGPELTHLYQKLDSQQQTLAKLQKYIEDKRGDESQVEPKNPEIKTEEFYLAEKNIEDHRFKPLKITSLEGSCIIEFDGEKSTYSTDNSWSNKTKVEKALLKVGKEYMNVFKKISQDYECTAAVREIYQRMQTMNSFFCGYFCRKRFSRIARRQ